MNYKQFSTYDVQPNLKEKNKKKDEKQHSNLLVYPHIIMVLKTGTEKELEKKLITGFLVGPWSNR